MLNNLKMIYQKEGESLKCLSVVERLLILDPGCAQEIRDRAHLCLRLECLPQALEDFETYLKLVPFAEDADKIRRQLASLKKRPVQLH
jgi:regulator of sirC expression with transglutaminase-like and TPR domain